MLKKLICAALLAILAATGAHAEALPTPEPLLPPEESAAFVEAMFRAAAGVTKDGEWDYREGMTLEQRLARNDECADYRARTLPWLEAALMPYEADVLPTPTPSPTPAPEGIVYTTSDSWAAFFESDLERLIAAGLKQVPKRCKFRELVNDTLELCRRYDNVKLILRKVLKKYGHPDCTNLYENVAITLIALLKGDLDFIKTGMDALNCGFDTDCTCATAGAIVGLIRGAEDILSQYDFAGLKYVLSVRSNRRSDLVKDLAEDISFLGCEFNKGLIEGAPELSFEFSKRPTYPFDITVSYEDDLPLVSPERDCKITLHLLNKSDKTVECDFTLTGMGLKECFSLAVCPGEKADYSFTASVKGQSSFTNRNPLVLNFDYAGERKSFEFGIAASLPWKVIGPIWKTDPECTTEALVAADLQYRKITYAVPYDGNRRDISRRFHLNFAADTKTEYLTPDQCFEPMCCDETTPYEQGIFYPTDDNIRMDELFGFKGPCMCYLAQKLLIDHDKDICVQIGHSSPFELYINGELIARRDNCDNWYAENVHVEGVKLKKGENLVVLRLTRVNADAKYNLFFSEGVTCARHYPHLGAVDPTAF